MELDHRVTVTLTEINQHAYSHYDIIKLRIIWAIFGQETSSAHGVDLSDDELVSFCQRSHPPPHQSEVFRATAADILSSTDTTNKHAFEANMGTDQPTGALGKIHLLIVELL